MSVDTVINDTQITEVKMILDTQAAVNDLASICNKISSVVDVGEWKVVDYVHAAIFSVITTKNNYTNTDAERIFSVLPSPIRTHTKTYSVMLEHNGYYISVIFLYDDICNQMIVSIEPSDAGSERVYENGTTEVIYERVKQILPNLQ